MFLLDRCPIPKTTGIPTGGTLNTYVRGAYLQEKGGEETLSWEGGGKEYVLVLIGGKNSLIIRSVWREGGL